jgi:hypothetical protein
MTERKKRLRQYFNHLTGEDRKELKERMEKYRPGLEEQGYEVVLAEGENNFFAGVLVIDREGGRFGFLEPSGNVAWITGKGDIGGIGALGSAIVQNPTEKLENQVEGLENTELE